MREKNTLFENYHEYKMLKWNKIMKIMTINEFLHNFRLPSILVSGCLQKNM